MANSSTTLNPTTTYAAYAPDFRGESKNLWQTAALGTGAAVTLPKIEAFPAAFLISQPADTAANSRQGVIVAHTASLITANGANVSLTAAAQTIVPSISAGVITLTSNATYGNAATTAPVSVIRLT